MMNVARRLGVGAALLGAMIAVSAARNQSPGAGLEHIRNIATLAVAVTPNGAVPSYVQCTWTATVTGGVAPYHYAWTVNNVPMGSDSPYLQYTNNGSAFRVLVTVTDQNAEQAWDSNVMSVWGSSCAGD